MSKASVSSTSDHRSRVASQRREKMRGRLIESAIAVLGQSGVTSNAIEEITTTAGVSRGIFYHYFRTLDDLREAVATEVGNAIMRVVDPALQRETDPVVRVSNGIRLVLTLTRTEPYLGAFLARGGIRALKANSLVMDYLPRDIERGIASGQFNLESSFMGVRLVVGPVLALLDDTLAKQQFSESFASRFAGAILRALGVTDTEAQEIARRPLPNIEPLLAIDLGPPA